MRKAIIKLFSFNSSNVKSRVSVHVIGCVIILMLSMDIFELFYIEILITQSLILTIRLNSRNG